MLPLPLRLPRMPVRHARRFVGAVALLVIGGGAAPASAQSVTGTVREQDTGRPLAETLVALTDTEGRRIAATVSSAAGTFAFDAPVGGPYRLELRHIGYEEATSPWFTVTRGPSVQLDPEMSVRVFQLEGIDVSASRSCRTLAAAGPELTSVWNEAVTALEIIAWTAQSQSVVYDAVEFRRELDTESLDVLRASRELKREALTGSPYISVPADTLLEYGYVKRASDGSRSWQYWAPDAVVLLSNEFLETHCFGFDPGSTGNRIGIRFEPVVSRALPEIEGVFWLDRASAELRSLEFTYVNLPSDHPESPHVGGRVEFANLPSGGWIVDEWRIRVPNVDLVLRGARIRRSVTAILEQGARVLRAETPEGKLLLEDETNAQLEAAPVERLETDRPEATPPTDSLQIPDSVRPTVVVAPQVAEVADTVRPVPLAGLEAVVEGLSFVERLQRSQLESRGFFEREEAGFGDFFPPELIEARQLLRFSDIVVRLPGVGLDADGILKFRAGQCEPNIWIDGILVLRGESGRRGFPELDAQLRRIDGRILPADVLAVEVYRTLGATPIEYTTPNAACGTILIWTG